MCTSTVKMGRKRYVINAVDHAPGNDDFEPEEQSSSRDVEVQINNQLYSEDLVKIARDALAKQPLNEEGFVPFKPASQKRRMKELYALSPRKKGRISPLHFTSHILGSPQQIYSGTRSSRNGR